MDSTVHMTEYQSKRNPTVKVRKKAKINNRIPHLTQVPYGKVTKTQENVKNDKRAKSSAHYQQVTTSFLRLQGTGKTV